MTRPLDVWPDSQVETALQHLALVLEDVPGVAYVNRQAIRPTELAAAQLPAILIDDSQLDYSWIKRQAPKAGQGRILDVNNQVRLELISRYERSRGELFNQSTVRAAFVTAVLNALVNNPTLEVDGVAAVQDCCQGGFRVQHRRVAEPYTSTIITLGLDLYECLDERSGTTWQQIILELYKYGDDEPRPTITIDLTT